MSQIDYLAIRLAVMACRRGVVGVRGFRRTLRRLCRDEAGATAIEYGLIIAGISIAILATVFAIGEHLDNIFTLVQTRMNSRFSRL